ncbi:ExeM/NucH family extracellular endonuclease [Lysobacter arenosi]|uniref:ExeM/NucH family extracellular endonuclease n=1 Tax=Lysobacter arenosi TaxID=2795387 RepID=A0ABX7R8Z1_9GAMM|nr:ExeM/NucH family extracellular endonuclease [Lysobacter arenosi]QSX74215.1 ExeM/NucH family extracellular endonuclease [Lysobacter arenosi]
MTRPRPTAFVLLLAPCLLAGCGTLPGAGTDAVAPDTIAVGHVQGNGAQSPLLGQTVTIEGVVSQRAGSAGGWFVQDTGDGDEATSDAILVADSQTAAPIQPGDRVRVRGVVVEQAIGRASRTALEQTQIQKLGRGTLKAFAVADALPDWERLEGMTLRVDAPLLLADSGDLGKHGRVLASVGERLWQSTERAEPGSDAQRAVVADNARRQLWLEANDGTAAWPDGLAQARNGSRLDGVSGVLDQAQSGYRLQLDAMPTLHAAARPQPPQVPGDFRIAALNLENLFNGDGHGGGFPTPRGARTSAELTAQLAKHVATINGLDADIVALMELENDGYGRDSSIATLVDALNAQGGTWRFVDAGQGPGDNAIRVGLIYRSDRVRTQGRPATMEGGPFGPHSRAPMAQAFVPLKDGRVDGSTFVVVPNHFKSKGCSGAEGADRDQGDGAACWNATRTLSARVLASFLLANPTGYGRALTLLVGDFNAYARESPLRTLEDDGWRDAFAVAGVASPYSYVYDGQLGRLDHALLSPALAQRLRGAAEWHSNADEPDSAGYRAGGAGPWRSSDHDPLLLGFDLRGR